MQARNSIRRNVPQRLKCFHLITLLVQRGGERLHRPADFAEGGGKVALLYNGDRHVLETGDSALLDGGAPHGWQNLGSRTARALWVILG